MFYRFQQYITGKSFFLCNLPVIYCWWQSPHDCFGLLHLCVTLRDVKPRARLCSSSREASVFWDIDNLVHKEFEVLQIPTETRTGSCTIRSGTHWIRRLEWLKRPMQIIWKISSLPMTQLQCGQVWKPSPATRHHLPSLRWINSLLMTWMSFIVDLKPPHTHPDHLSTHPLTPPVSPSPLHLHSRSLKKMSTRSSERTREERHQAQIVWQPENLCWPAGPHLFTDLQ